MKDTTSTSNFEFCDEDASLNVAFADFQEIPTSGCNVLVKANRNGKRLVLKGLKEEYRQKKVYEEALRKEYDILSSLQHPNIISAEGFEEVEGLGQCIVLEYAGETNLRDALAAGMDRVTKLKIVRELLDAVEYIHMKQIVHRDLKPSNIMVLDDGGYVKIIDFGLSDSDVYTFLKQPSGTEAFMAPEQKVAAGSDTRNDIYSLGCILECMKLGKKFDGIIARCKRPIEERYQTMAALRDDFDSVCRRKARIWLAAAALVAVSLCLFGVRYHWMDYVYAVARSINLTHYSFKKDGLYYNIISKEEGTLELTCGGDFGAYENDITVPDSVEYNGRTYAVVRIGDDAFRQCRDLIGIVLPPTIRSIGNNAFMDCDSLATVNLPDGITEMGDSLFRRCGWLHSVHFSEKMKVIPPYCFTIVKSLRTFRVPNGVTSIQRDAFGECLITEITLPKGLREIERGAFWECINLKEIHIPAGVERIGDYVFWGCNSLKDVYVERAEPLPITDIFYKLKDVRLHVPKGSAEAYRNAEWWKSLTVVED